MQQHTTAISIVVILVVLKIYRHARSELRFQKFVKCRLLARITLMAIIGVALLSTGYSQPVRYIFDTLGILVGGAIACYSIQTSAFERRNQDWFYRQNPWIGKCILVIVAGRFIHKGYEDIRAILGDSAGMEFTRHGSALAEYANDPSLTAFIFILVAYNVIFYALIIRKAQQWKLSDQRDEPSAG